MGFNSAFKGLNKNAGSKFDPVQRSGGARNLQNSVRDLSDQASCFPNHKVALSQPLSVQHIVS